MEDEAQGVVQADPAHPLSPVAQSGTGPELEHREHPCESAAGRGEDHAEARVDHADACVCRQAGGGLPGDPGFRQEVAAGSARFGERLVAAASVDPDRRRRHEHPGLSPQAGERRGQQARAGLAALPDPALPVRVPPGHADVLPGEVDDGIHPLERRAIDRPGGGIPGDLARAGLAPDQGTHHVSPGGEEVGEGRPEHAGRAGDRDRQRGQVRAPVGADVLGHRGVTVAKGPVEATADEEGVGQGAGGPEGRCVGDPVEHPGAAAVGRLEAVLVDPGREGPLHLLVHEAAGLDGVAVPGHPASRERPLPDPELDGAAVGDPARAPEHPHVLPGRGQPLEGARAEVPGPDRPGRGVEDGAVFEGRHGRSHG